MEAVKQSPRPTFEEWIDREGVESLAKRLRVNANTSRNWRFRKAYPRVEQMKVIKRISKGEIDYAQIIEGGRR